jgi:hypothetical protein
MYFPTIAIHCIFKTRFARATIGLHPKQFLTLYHATVATLPTPSHGLWGIAFGGRDHTTANSRQEYRVAVGYKHA